MKVTGLWVVMALAFAGCGPSTGEIKRARLAVYQGPSAQIFDMAMQETQATYKIGEVNGEKRTFATLPQWYSAEGSRQSATNEGNGDFVRLQGGSVVVSFIVQIMEVGGGKVAIEITPKTMQVVSWSPQPRELTPDDPNLPPWIKGRVDSLALAIYNRARNFATSP